MTTQTIISIARSAHVGQYLARYADDGLDAESDRRSLCGCSEMTIDAARQVLARRGLRLVTDDLGLVVAAAEVSA